MAINSNCPNPETLRGLIDDSLPAAEMQVIQSHVDQCPDCQKRLETLVAGTESWDAAIGHLRQEGLPVGESVFSEAMRKMKEEDFVASHAHQEPNSSNPLEYLAPSDQPGSMGRLGPYEVTQVIGQGGMGVVLRAYDPSLHRVVAVKVLAPYLAHNPQARKRFVREAQAIAAVTHDHVITIHAIDESADQPRIVMHFVDGRSLQQKIDTEGSLDLKEILRIGMQTASGLSAAHAQGLVHRDVKPSNILLENGIHRVRLTDFGLARAVDDASLTQSGVIAGTPQYMAPEQANGDAVDHRADLFSLGSVMYAMCVGHSPFRASTTMGVLKRVCNDPPRPIQELNPDIPVWLSNIILKLLAKNPADRFQSAREVAELLERWLAHVQLPRTVERPPLTSAVSDAIKQTFAKMAKPEWQAFNLKWPPSAIVAVVALLMSWFVFFSTPYTVVDGNSKSPVVIQRPFSFNFLFLAFTVWAIALLVVALTKLGNSSSTAKTPEVSSFDGNPKDPAKLFVSRYVALLNWQLDLIRSAASWVFEQLEQLCRFLSRLSAFRKSSQLKLAVAWFGSAVFDLFHFLAFVLVIPPKSNPQPSLFYFFVGLAIMIAFMGLFSVVVAWGLYVGRFLPLVWIGAFAGLIPISPVRLLVSIATLVWLHYPENIQSYGSTPWNVPEPEVPDVQPATSEA